MNTATNIIGIKDATLPAGAFGLQVMWDLSGNVTLDKLTNALAAQGSQAIPPEEPSTLVALHRAVDAVAKLTKADAHMVSRGEWRIVGDVQVDAASLRYPVNAEACVDGDGILAVGDGADKIHEAFEIAKRYLAPSDVGHWLCAKLRALDAVPLKEAGGVYFVPRANVERFRRLQRAVEAASAHKFRTMPCVDTADALDMILSAITNATREACDKIVDAIPTDGQRALATKEAATHDILNRVAKYETLLGVKLDELHKLVEETRAATATAMLALGGDD